MLVAQKSAFLSCGAPQEMASSNMKQDKFSISSSKNSVFDLLVTNKIRHLSFHCQSNPSGRKIKELRLFQSSWDGLGYSMIKS